jgi:hypothetical protein
VWRAGGWEYREHQQGAVEKPLWDVVEVGAADQTMCSHHDGS